MKNILRTPFKYRYFYAVPIIIALNVAVFLVTRLNRNLVSYLGLSVVGTAGYGFWFELVTYMFTHSNLTHILCNMLGLLFFGVSVERSVGSTEFCVLYFFCGIAGGLLSLLLYRFTGSYQSVLVGASGAVYSVLLVYAVLFPRSVISIWGIIPVPAPLLILLYAVIEIASQVFTVSNVAHYAHLFGFALAWLYLVVRMGLHPISVWRNAWRK